MFPPRRREAAGEVLPEETISVHHPAKSKAALRAAEI